MFAISSRHVVVMYLALAAAIGVAVGITIGASKSCPGPYQVNVPIPVTKNPAKEWDRPPGDEKGKPKDPPSPESFLGHYWTGKKFRSDAVVDITGRGSNTRWVFKGSGHFAYRSRLIAETTVIQNDGTTADFDVAVLDAAQLLAVRQFDKLRLVPPEKSLLNDIAPIADKLLLRMPQYRFVRVAVVLANMLDPGLELTLTTFIKQLKIGDGLVEQADDLEVLERLGDLQGQHLRIRYVRNLGIMKIQVLNGKTLPDATLASIAHNSSLLMDYYLSAAGRPVGAMWRVDAGDVAGLFQDGFSASAKGTLDVTRKDDESIDGDKLATLQVAKDAKIELEYDVEGEHQTSVLQPITDSTIYYSVGDNLIRRARLDWTASLSRFSVDHLLFGTRDVREVELKTFYSAEIVGSSKQVQPAPPDTK